MTLKEDAFLLLDGGQLLPLSQRVFAKLYEDASPRTSTPNPGE